MNSLKRLYYSLPVIRELRVLQSLANRQNIAQRDEFVHRALASPKYADRRKLNHFEFQVFSQNGEDGIIGEIFRRIGTRSRRFIEIGVGNGLENNTAFLLAQGWLGGWI